VADGLLGPALLFEAAAEREVRVVVDRLELEDDAELLLGFGEAVDAEVRDAKRLPDGRFLRLAPLGLFERDGRLGVHARRHLLSPLLEEIVGLAHLPSPQRYGKFSLTTSAGRVRSRVGPN
jgi:hypothetical protein